MLKLALQRSKKFAFAITARQAHTIGYPTSAYCDILQKHLVQISQREKRLATPESQSGNQYVPVV